MNEYRGRKSLDLDLLEVETKINVLFRLVNSAFNDCMESFYEKDLILSKKIIVSFKENYSYSNVERNFFGRIPPFGRLTCITKVI